MCMIHAMIFLEDGSKWRRRGDWNVCYHYAVGDHNNLRYSLPSIEDTSTTDSWECWVFAFILAISEFNALKIIITIYNFITLYWNYVLYP